MLNLRRIFLLKEIWCGNSSFTIIFGSIFLSKGKNNQSFLELIISFAFFIQAKVILISMTDAYIWWRSLVSHACWKSVVSFWKMEWKDFIMLLFIQNIKPFKMPMAPYYNQSSGRSQERDCFKHILNMFLLSSTNESDFINRFSMG